MSSFFDQFDNLSIGPISNFGDWVKTSLNDAAIVPSPLNASRKSLLFDNAAVYSKEVSDTFTFSQKIIKFFTYVANTFTATMHFTVSTADQPIRFVIDGLENNITITVGEFSRTALLQRDRWVEVMFDITFGAGNIYCNAFYDNSLVTDKYLEVDGVDSFDSINFELSYLGAFGGDVYFDNIALHDFTTVAPIVTSQTLSVDKNSSIEIIIDESDGTIFITTLPFNGSLSRPNANYVYTPATDFVGEDMFDFVLYDENLVSQKAIITFNVIEGSGGGGSGGGENENNISSQTNNMNALNKMTKFSLVDGDGSNLNNVSLVRDFYIQMSLVNSNFKCKPLTPIKYLYSAIDINTLVKVAFLYAQNTG